MSPPWGHHEGTTLGRMQDHCKNGAESNTGSQQSGCGSQCVDDTSISPIGNDAQSPTPPRLTSRPNSHVNLSEKDTSNMTASRLSNNRSAPSVKSMSSTENSRRDSAISAKSQHGRRPKTSRSSSKRSIQSMPRGSAELSRTWSHGSKHRPRGHRFASSTSINLPQPNIEEALAMHARSCEIFSSSSRPSTSYAQACSPHGSPIRPGHVRGMSTVVTTPVTQTPAHYNSPYQNYHSVSSHDIDGDDDQYYTTSFPPTVIHWTSDEVRMKQYAAIDRSNSGLRGLLKKLLPKCILKDHGKFYDEKDGSDAGSVRRIRLDFAAEKQEPTTVSMPRAVHV